MPKVNKDGFNQAAYVQQYHREHYRKITAAFKLDEAQELERAAEAAGMTKSAYIKRAVIEQISRDKGI